jgi:phosphate transport system ATP-binding protein
MLVRALAQRYTVVIVTHDVQQAARLSDFAAFFYLGKVVEFDRSQQIFTTPRERRTEDYVTGKFG